MIRDGNSLIENELDSQIRRAAMAWLDQRCTDDNPLVRRDELLNVFYFEGARLPLVDPNGGIR